MFTFVHLLVGLGLCATVTAICDVPKNVPALNRTDNSTTGILRLLREGEKLLEVDKEDEDMVVFMGLTGAGKTTFVLHLSGSDDDLTSVQTSASSREYIIVDQCNRSSTAAKTLESHTLIPDRFIDSETNLTYFDMPGFSDTRPLVAYDIAATYFTKKVLDHAKRMKLVFVINYSAVKVGEDRGRLPELLEHITTLIHNLSTFQDSIALVVSKVDNIYDYSAPDANFPFVSDEVMVEGVADFLINARANYVEKDRLKEVQLIDILLHRKDDKFDRIGLFRRPHRAGPLKNVSVIQRSTEVTRNIIDVNLHFAKSNNTDFGYTISDKSKNLLQKLKEERQQNAMRVISAVGERIRTVIRSREDAATDLVDMVTIFPKGNTLDLGSCKAIADLIDHLDEFVRISNFNVAMDETDALKRDADIMNYLNQISPGTAIDWLPIIQSSMAETVEYLRGSHSWYHLFLNTTYDVLSGYEVQRARARINSSFLIQRIEELEKRPQTNVAFLEKEMSQFSESAGIDSLRQIYSSLKGMELNKKKLMMFEKVLSATLEKDVIIECRDNKLTIRGTYIVLSRVVDDILSCSGARFIEITALETIFLDNDLDLVGKEAQIFIVAPVWTVIGQVKILLNGADAPRYESAARSGVESNSQYQRDGENGAPGVPGGSAGHFFGMGGHFINSEQLLISAIGGKGGDGQKGGDGSTGTSRSTPQSYTGTASVEEVYSGYRKKHHLQETSGFWRSIGYVLGIAPDRKVYDVEIVLPPADKGGNGGNGGSGGIGGNEGKVNLFNYNTGKTCSAKILSFKGDDGMPGEPGRGGPGGEVGRTLVERYTEEKYWWSGKYGSLKFWGYTDPSHTRADDGSSGAPGKNNAGIQYPATVNFADYNASIVSYKAYARDNLSNDMRRTIRTTLSKLDATQR